MNDTGTRQVRIKDRSYSKLREMAKAVGMPMTTALSILIDKADLVVSIEQKEEPEKEINHG